jgi:hypothetical protein
LGKQEKLFSGAATVERGSAFFYEPAARNTLTARTVEVGWGDGEEDFQ